MVMALVAAFAFTANAQVKTPAAAKQAVVSAKADTENPKKNAKFATWMKYGQALYGAYEAATGSGWVGASRQELQLVSKNEKCTAVETVSIQGQNWEKEVYETRNYYFDPMGFLRMIEVTHPVVDNALEDAVKAYEKAHNLDAKGSKTKDITAAIKQIADKFVEEAVCAYTLQDYGKASYDFEQAVIALGTAPCSELDTNSLYNAGITAWQAGELQRAKGFFEQCLEYGYYGSEGECYAKLAEIADKEGDPDKKCAILEEGFLKFPQGQGILVGLINHYSNQEGSADRLFELLAEAKRNEPNNASIYYAEGNVHAKLGNYEEAKAQYRKSAEIDPNFYFGYVGEGIMFYNLALKYSDEAANEMDYKKYDVLVAKMEKALKDCIEPFEKAFELCNDPNNKLGVAEYLKSTCFRFRMEDPSYMERYEKYKAFIEANSAEAAPAQ